MYYRELALLLLTANLVWFVVFSGNEDIVETNGDVQALVLADSRDQQPMDQASQQVSASSPVEAVEIPLALPEKPDLDIEESAPLQQTQPALEHAPVAEKPKRFCVTLGPWSDEAGMRSFLQSIDSSIIYAKVRKGTADAITGFWVITPSQRDLRTAEEYYDKIKSAGIEDAWLIKAGPRANRISLGYYKERDRAELVQGQVRDKGFKALVTADKAESQQYWVDLSMTSQNATKPDILTTIADMNAEQAGTIKECDNP